MKSKINPAGRYFDAMFQAFEGLDIYLREDESPLYRHHLIGGIVVDYLERLRSSFSAWENRLAFAEKFRISQAESGFPIYQNVLELENDRNSAKKKLAGIPDEDTIREEMVDFILRKKKFPLALQKSMAERYYLEDLNAGGLFAPLVLPRTVRVSVNPKTKRPFYVVHWATFDGSSHLPLVYVLTVEDSSDALVKQLVSKSGKMNKNVNVPLPVDGLLNPDLAHRFDDFCEKNSSYGLTLSTIASNMDKDFDELHPKQLYRFVLGPFYNAGVTSHGQTVERVLKRVHKPENAWMMTWTVQEIYSVRERPEKRGLWSNTPAREEYHINTDDLECARQGVSEFRRHALVPHEAYQAIYSAGQQAEIFDGYHTHIISDGEVLRDV